MAYEIEARFEQIGTQILEGARNALYMNMRYLDVALSGLAYEMTTDIERIGTDGFRLIYEPHYLADLYRKNPMLVNRAYLHIVMHCVFRHLLKPCREDARLWNLSCDIAVEALIDGMHHRSIRMGAAPFRKELYGELNGKLRVLTAEGVYKVLREKHLTPGQTERLSLEFCIDDHTFWPGLPEGKKPPGMEIPPGVMMQRLQKKWQDISEKMQTELQTGRDPDRGDGDLLGKLKVENRERYDYRAFLRKFAVLREEMQVDADSFDYVFYSYGLRLYGNMPLIEPQEWKEVRKIEEFVIAIDTSMSCSGDLVKKFLEETYSVLSETESFFKKVHIRILQCDEAVRSDRLITKAEDLKEYMEHMELYGNGGTDFRPVFAHIRELQEQGELTGLRGLLYFTDGRGTFPKRRPPYDTAFIIFREDYKEVSVPAWAIRLVLSEDDI